MDLARRLKPMHLRLILKIAESGKLQSAANALAMSQPAASRILAEIESQVGTPLFIRHPKGMEATPLGEAFVKHARVILTEFDNLEAEAKNLNIGHVGKVRIGSVTGPTIGCLVPAIRQVKETSPEIEATIEVGPSTQLVRGLEEGRYDFILARLPPDHDSREFRIYPARTEVASLIVNRSHPLVGKPRVKLSDLVDFEWVIQERGSPIRQAVEGVFHANGLPVPRNITNSSSLLVVLAILEHSDAIAPQSQEVAGILTRQGVGANLAILDLSERIVVSPYFIIQHRAQQLPRAAERVLEEVLIRL